MINGFYGNNYWLSNFCFCRIQYDGYVYWSTESAYQAQKFSGNPITKNRIKSIFTKLDPTESKALGVLVPLRQDWQKIRDDLMQELVRLKYQDKKLKSMLLNTGSKQLIASNTWHDTHFGCCQCEKHKGEGQNILGKITMKIRDELNEQEKN